MEGSAPSDDISYPNIKSIIIGKKLTVKKEWGKLPQLRFGNIKTLGKRKRKEIPRTVPNLCLTIKLQ